MVSKREAARSGEKQIHLIQANQEEEEYTTSMQSLQGHAPRCGRGQASQRGLEGDLEVCLGPHEKPQSDGTHRTIASLVK